MSVAPIRQLKQNYGGVEVSYYDGSTLLGTQKVPKGKDALHPSITVPTKSGYTFVGWATTNDIEDWVGTLVAGNDPITLYAIYVANTLTVVSGGSNQNPKYVSGTFAVSVDPHWSTASQSGSFTLLKRRYATATCVAYAMFYKNDSGGLDVGDATFDGDAIIGTWIVGGSEGSKSYVIGDGGHSIYVSATAYDDYSQGALVRVSSLVLSNPISWT